MEFGLHALRKAALSAAILILMLAQAGQAASNRAYGQTAPSCWVAVSAAAPAPAPAPAAPTLRITKISFPNATAKDRSHNYLLTDVTPYAQLVDQGEEQAKKLTNKEVRDILGIEKGMRPFHADDLIGYSGGYLKEQVSRAMKYLVRLDVGHGDGNDQAQLKLVTAWEELAKELMIFNEFEWQANRFFGDDGSIGYSGPTGQAIIFTRSGEIYRGLVDPYQINSQNIWPASFEGMRQLR